MRRMPSIKALLFTLAGVWAAAGLGIYSLTRLDHQQDITMLLPRSQAPSFSLPDQSGKLHDLRDYEKRSVALAFLPGDSDEVRGELRSLKNEMKRFDKIGVKVFAVAAMEKATARQLHESEQLNFPILTDVGGKIGQQFGVAPGRPYVSYVLGPERKVLLPIATVQPKEHGTQLVELASCFFDTFASGTNPLIDKPVADATLPRVNGKGTETLYSDKKQKATVLLFLSARCPCSGGYDVRNQALADAYQSKGVRFVAINSSADETDAEIAAHAKAHGFTFPVLRDADHKIADTLNAQVTPEAFVMDAQGILRYHGRIDDSRDEKTILSHDLRNALDFLVAGQNPKVKSTTPFGCSIARQKN
ncbi:redoxin domain-containing protein [Armatimonas sp.]|uniref:redoxin domain-containing protein n=1 Tax=Armatimonas sp. TaxID=1872638 RepID=UPI00286D0588|nr:redoxin domain-containing protein [Armatimonas sp.]